MECCLYSAVAKTVTTFSLLLGASYDTLKCVHEYPAVLCCAWGADIYVDEEQLFPLLHDSQQTLSASDLISLDNFRV